MPAPWCLPALLGWAKPGAELIDTAPLDLEQIVAGIIEAHRAGKRVVRVHSGDTALFSAMQEQLEILEKEEIPCRVIPGVTAAAAAAAALAQELTLPEVTQTVILTRAPGRTPVPEREALRELARHGATMVIYLSIKLIDTVVAELIQAYGPEAPAVVAYRVSWPDQQIIRGTLADIAAKVKAGRHRAPGPDPGGAGPGRPGRAASRPTPNSMTRPLPMDSAPAKPIRVVALTPRGAALARRLCRELPGAQCWLPRAQAGDDPGVKTFDPLAPVFQEAFRAGRKPGLRHGRGHRGAQHRPLSPGQRSGPRGGGGG